MNERDTQQIILEKEVLSLQVDTWRTELENLKEKSLHDFGVEELFLNTLNIKTSRIGCSINVNFKILYI